MLMAKERRPAIRTLRGWAISVLQEAGAIRECEEHGWMQDLADPHARERACDIAAGIRRLASRWRQRPWRSQKCWTRSAITVRSARQSSPRPPRRRRRTSGAPACGRAPARPSPS